MTRRLRVRVRARARVVDGMIWIERVFNIYSLEESCLGGCFFFSYFLFSFPTYWKHSIALGLLTH